MSGYGMFVRVTLCPVRWLSEQHLVRGGFMYCVLAQRSACLCVYKRVGVYALVRVTACISVACLLTFPQCQKMQDGVLLFMKDLPKNCDYCVEILSKWKMLLKVRANKISGNTNRRSSASGLPERAPQA